MKEAQQTTAQNRTESVEPTNKLDGLGLEAPDLAPFIQAQLQVGSADDPMEKEADQVAEQVIAKEPADTPTLIQETQEEKLRRKIAPSLSSVQPNASQGENVSPDFANQLQQSTGHGSPLPDTSRAEMEGVFGVDFGGVKLHTDSRAEQLTQQIHAKAFTHGEDIYFNQGRLKPETTEGKRLLSHELTHVVQQGGNQHLIQRDQEVGEQAGTTGTNAEGIGQVFVSLSGMRFVPPSGFQFERGPTRPQVFRVILRALLGAQYQEGMEGSVSASFPQRTDDNPDGFNAQGAFHPGTTAEDGELPQSHFRLDIPSSMNIILMLQRQGLTLLLRQDQLETIRLGFASHQLFHEVQSRLFFWYSRFIFERQMSFHADLLRQYNALLEEGNTTSGEERQNILDAIVGNLRGPALVAEQIRNNTFLASPAPVPEGEDARPGQNAALMYRVLFNLDRNDRTPISRPPRQVYESQMALLLAFISTQEVISDRIVMGGEEGREASIVLLDRFERYVVRAILRSTQQADEELLDAPPSATDPPFPSRMTIHPALGPVNMAVVNGEYTFTMNIRYSHFTDAFASTSFQWERVRLPEPNMSSPDTPEEAAIPPEQRTPLAVDRPGIGDIAGVRYARTARYNQADLERIQEDLGIFSGLGARDLVEFNNLMRYVGTTVGLGFDIVSATRYDKTITFPEEGLYMVRCRAVPILEGDEEVVRVPSAAYMLVTVRNPDTVAQEQVEQTLATQEAFQGQIADINAQLAAPLSSENPEILQRQLAFFEAQTASNADRLTSQEARLDQAIMRLVVERVLILGHIARLEAAGPERQEDLARWQTREWQWRQNQGVELRRLESQRTEIQQLISTRDSRLASLRNSENLTSEQVSDRLSDLTATFVTDEGSSMALALEVVDLGSGQSSSTETPESTETTGRYSVYISDLTTPRGGHANGTGTNKVNAIKDGIKRLLETSSDYGRGRVAVNIEGTVEVIEIQAGTGRIFSEAIENATMVVSLAAIAAAPFTGGASLYILIPVGIVGAAPSAYRLYNRWDASILRFDMETVSDVLNIAGAIFGTAQFAVGIRAAQMATPSLRILQAGRALMIVGFGTDGAGILLLGAGVIQQLEATRGLPENIRRARIAQIMSNAFLQLGVMAAGEAASRFQVGADTGQIGPGRRPAPGDGPDATPGRRLTPPTEAEGSAPRQRPDTEARTPAAESPTQQSTMAGTRRPGGESGDPPATDTTPVRLGREPAEAQAPDRLREVLESGIDRSRRRPAETDAPTQEVRRGLYRSEETITHPDRAYEVYNEALAAVGHQREVAIYYDRSTGEYLVSVGDEGGVSLYGRPQAETIVHFHPNPNNVLTYRLPAPADFNDMLFRVFREGGSVREFVEFDIPGVGRGRTEFGIDMNNPEPFYVKIHLPDETTQTIRFETDGDYTAYWGSRTTYVDPASPAYQRMIEDIQAYIRDLDSQGRFDSAGELDAPDPNTRTMAGSRRRRRRQTPAEGEGSDQLTPPESTSGETAAPAPPTRPSQPARPEIPDGWLRFPALRRMIQGQGLSADNLNRIMANAARMGADAENFLVSLRYGLTYHNQTPGRHTDQILAGLASSDPATFQASHYLMRRMHLQRGDGIDAINLVLDRLSLGQIAELGLIHGGAGSLLNDLNFVLSRASETNSGPLMELLRNSAGENGGIDIARLARIVQGMEGNGPHGMAEINTALAAENAFDAQVRQALNSGNFEDLVQQIWGEQAQVVEGQPQVGRNFESGSDIIDAVLGPRRGRVRERMANLSTAGLDDTGTAVDPVKWFLVRRAIEGADIPLGIKNNLIGALWGATNIQALRNIPGARVFTEVAIVQMVNGQRGVEAHADAVVVLGNRTIVVEFKAGDGTRSRSQRVIYPLIEQGQVSGMQMSNPELRQRSRSSWEFVPINERDLLTVGLRRLTIDPDELEF